MRLDVPLQLSPVFKPKIWGRSDLAPLFNHPVEAIPRGAKRPGRPQAEVGSRELIGEVWITDDCSRFVNGPVAGLTLAEACAKSGQDIYGKSWPGPRFPILSKYIYTSDWLSVQVHPDDAYAAIHDPGNVGKCEMWYVIRADRDAALLLGLKEGTTKEALLESFRKNTSKDLLLNFHPRKGEALFIPPGTVHALGPGLVLFEVEENSDLTYRLDDFGRLGLDGKPRPLHWDKGLEVTRVELPSCHNLPRISIAEPFGSRRYVLASRFFALEELLLRKRASFDGRRDRVEVFSVIEGEGRIETESGWLGYHSGDTWLIPPAAKKYRVVPLEQTSLLKFYVPELDKDFRIPLTEEGVAQSKIDSVVFA